MSFDAFKDDIASLDIGGLTFENNAARVSIYGSLNIGLDQQGLQQARLLQTIFNDMVRYMEQQNLPAKIENFSPKAVKNPFLNNE